MTEDTITEYPVEETSTLAETATVAIIPFWQPEEETEEDDSPSTDITLIGIGNIPFLEPRQRSLRKKREVTTTTPAEIEGRTVPYWQTSEQTVSPTEDDSTSTTETTLIGSETSPYWQTSQRTLRNVTPIRS